MDEEKKREQAKLRMRRYRKKAKRSNKQQGESALQDLESFNRSVEKVLAKQKAPRLKKPKAEPQNGLEINDHMTGNDNPDVRFYDGICLQSRHWRFAERKASAYGMSMQRYFEWLVRRDMQLDPARREMANSLTISGEPIIGRTLS